MWKSYQRISGGACVISTTSVKDRLKNQAAANGKTMQEALIAYGLEKTVYRLSISRYVEHFTTLAQKAR